MIPYHVEVLGKYSVASRTHALIAVFGRQVVADNTVFAKDVTDMLA
jgi:hypothetical protein